MSETVNPEDGTRIVYSATGSGTPVILVHGSGLSGAIWRGFGYVAALKPHYRVIAIDLRGHGRSDKPDRPADYRMELVLGDILAVLEAEEAHSAHYVGYSFGARAGFSLIDSHPERVRSLVAAGGTHRAPAGSVAELFFPGYDDALRTGGMPEFLRQWGIAAGRPIDGQTSAAFLANDAHALRAYFLQLEREPGIPDSRLRDLATPTMLFAGTRDRRRYTDSEDAARLMPDATFHPLAGRDHGSTLRPSGELLDLMLPFLAQH